MKKVAKKSLHKKSVSSFYVSVLEQTRSAVSSRIKRVRERPLEKKSEESVVVGGQDIMDLLSYSGLEETPDNLVVGGRFVRTLYVSGYPLVASSGWLDGLIAFARDLDISYHFQEVEAIYALPKLRRKITELESTKRAMMQAGKIIGSEITDPLESAIDLRDRILRGQEKLFQLSLSVGISASSLSELNASTKLLATELGARLFYLKVARYQQLEGLSSILPKGMDSLNQKRNLDSSSLALTFPLTSSELVHESGVLYGVNKTNNSLVILDRFALNNANSIIFAQSGSGKSYTSKVEILRQLNSGTSVIVIDPEREYKQLADSVEGTYIKLSTRSKQKINPFDLATNSYSSDDVSQQVQDLTEVISLMVDGISAKEKALLDKAIMQVYRQFKKQAPLLEDLYLTLKKLGGASLCERLERYIKGSLAHVFNEQTNISLTNRLVVFDIKDLPESMRQIMMMIIANFVSNQVKAKPQKRLLVIDEAWLLLEHEQSARFVASLVRRARKYYLGVCIISQQANDFLHDDYGRAIASQSSLRILMRQDTTTIEGVTREFHLSEYEESFLLTCERGDAIIIADQNHAAVHVVASPAEHPLITTNPLEVYSA